MTLKELKDAIRDLGFEEDSTMEDEYPEVVANAITRALQMINSTVKACVGKLDLIDIYDSLYEEVVDEDGNVSLVRIGRKGRFDLEELTKEDDRVIFDSIDRVVINTEEGVESYTDWDLLEGKVLVIDPMAEEDRLDITIYFNERINRVTSLTEDDARVQVDYACEPLVELLASHYVWLDDDERKAVYYWNEYDGLKQEIMAKLQKIKGRVRKGLRWHS